ncbi:hypothetical protein KF840_11905 [bacterium]|nr:hypothetical protein [bacterium]
MPTWCLPPVFEGGQRLHSSPAPRVNWLPLALRQHQLCWHAALRPDEMRVIVLGSSAVFGLGIWASETFSALLTADLAAAGVDAAVFNLAWVNPYQLRDAIILREAMAFHPDAIIYPLTLAEFVHVAPNLYGPPYAFFASNRNVVREMLADPPRGLEEPVQRYAAFPARADARAPLLERLRDLGSLTRAAAGELGAVLPTALGAPPGVPPGSNRKPAAPYDCEEVMAKQLRHFADWQSWNILAELEALHRETGVEVMVVYWPLAANPSGQCFSARFTYQDMADFGAWIGPEASRRGLAFVDLHDQLADDDFFDSVHVTAAGHRKVAERLRAPLDAMLERVRARRAAAASQSPP